MSELVRVIGQRTKTTIPIQEIEECYYKERYLLDGEIKDILMNCNEYRPKNIIICSACMKDFLKDNGLIDFLLATGPSTALTFIYNDKEYGIDKSIKWILDHATERDKNRLTFYALKEKKFIDYTIILCQPGFIVNVVYEKVKDNQQRCLLKEISDISFDTTKINEAFKKLSSILDDKE